MTDTPYSTADVALSMVIGSRTLVDIGCRAEIGINSREWGCEVVALAEEDRLITGLRGHSKTHLVDFNDASALDVLDSDSYHQVFAVDVVDTVVDPSGFLRKLAKRLEPDGQIVMNLPNVANTQIVMEILQGHLGGSFDQPESHRHRHLFDWAGVERIIGGAGLIIDEVIEIYREVHHLGERADLPTELFQALLGHSSSVHEWVVVAKLVPNLRESTPMRRWLRDAIERSVVIEESTEYARAIEATLSESQSEAGDLRSRLGDALLLKREVEWQNKVIHELTTRAEQGEERAGEVQRHYESAMLHYESAMQQLEFVQAELVATRMRLILRLLDPFARLLNRSRIIRAIVRMAGRLILLVK